ncbi:MAG: heme NO-binding domain-containing protein [Pseudomonadales bacterium]|nr:heme NO-binding domain-containing protein [Pseudomonadales bacterium]
MKGAVFIALGDMVSEAHGLNTWLSLLDEVCDDGVYTATMNYDDERLYRLVEAICSRLKVDASDALKSFGEYLFAALHKSAPIFADSKTTFLDFVESIGSVIHIEVYKLDEKARPPKITVLERTENSADLRYESDRKLCYLAEGLLKGAAGHYGVEVSVSQTQCMHEGADSCVLRITQNG